MRTGFVLAAALLAAPASAAEPAPPPRPAAPLVTRCYPVLDVIVPLPEPPVACAPLGVLRPVERRDVVQAAAVAACPVPAPMPSSKAVRDNADKLVRMLTGHVRPASWAVEGGRGTIQFDPKSNALTVRQTEDTHAEVAKFLAALRKITETQVVLEFRVIEVADTFFERVGVDFEVNAPGITPVAVREPCPAPKAEPGILTDAQVAQLLEAVQGDRRANVLSTPKVTAFDRQPVTVQITEMVTFLTGLELAVVPGGVEKREQVQAADVGTRITATPAVSADRTAVALDLGYEFATVDPAAPATPIQLSGAAGRIADAVLQKPAIHAGRVDAKLTIPVGKTALVTGPTFVREERREFGPPVLSKVPYVNRLYRNVSVGRTTSRHLLLVTARVIESGEVATAACKECCADHPAVLPEAARLVAAYRAACADGRTEEAMKLALRALALDPKCFAAEK